MCRWVIISPESHFYFLKGKVVGHQWVNLIWGICFTLNYFARDILLKYCNLITRSQRESWLHNIFFINTIIWLYIFRILCERCFFKLHFPLGHFFEWGVGYSNWGQRIFWSVFILGLGQCCLPSGCLLFSHLSLALASTNLSCKIKCHGIDTLLVK